MNYLNNNESREINKFLKNGYLIFNIDKTKELESFSNSINEIICNLLKLKSLDLNYFHKKINKNKINSVRMSIFKKISENNNLKKIFYLIFKDKIDLLVGNELAMQKQLNLSIQMPKDKSSVLTMHADTFNGESPFEVVAWLPLVDCYKNKSMYFINPNTSNQITKKLAKYSKIRSGGMKKIHDHLKNKKKYINIKFGEGLIFSPNFLHGNDLNTQNSTRFSINTRFKSLLSPYTSDEKSLGNFYESISMRPATKIGLNFKTPKGFKSE